jgi:preprotein translocase SecE subunit
VARDRKRAKQRRTRAGVAASARGEAGPPSPLEHASADVDEALAAEAGAVVDKPGEDEEIYDDELEEDADLAPARRGPVSGARTSGQGGTRVANFLRASWAELQRVQWPDRRQVTQATGVVLGFVLIAGAFLGLADLVSSHLVDFILK